MSLRTPIRVALHLIVALAMVLGGAVAPAVAATAALQSLPTPAPASMADMPCDTMPGMQAPATPPAPEQQKGPCTTQHCDLSACLGVACLPALPKVSDSLPMPIRYARLGNEAIPPGVIDTPLRPPNG